MRTETRFVNSMDEEIPPEKMAERGITRILSSEAEVIEVTDPHDLEEYDERFYTVVTHVVYN